MLFGLLIQHVKTGMTGFMAKIVIPILFTGKQKKKSNRWFLYYALFLRVVAMKVKIKSFNVELPEYLTLEKEYDFTISDSGKGGLLINDFADESYINLGCSAHLNDGSWVIVE